MQRTPKSCTNCKGQKRQCDRVTPICSRCQRTGVVCVYPDDSPTIAEYTATVIAMLERSVDLKNKVRLLNNRQSEGGENTSASGKTRIEPRRAEKKRKLGEVLETLQASLDEIGLEMNQLEVKDARQEIARPSSVDKVQKIQTRDSSATSPASFPQALWRLYPRYKDGGITFETDAKTLSEFHHALVHVLNPIIPPYISIPTKSTTSDMLQYSDESRQITKPTRLGTARLIVFAWVMLLEDQPAPTSLTPSNGPQLLERTLLIAYLDHHCCNLLRIDNWDKRQFMQRYESGQVSPLLVSSICVLSLCFAIPEHHCHSEDDLRNSYELADAYYVRARNLMEDLFDEPDLQTVQAIAILTFYVGARKHNFYLGKYFMDLCLRLAYSLGLHRLPDSSPRPDELEEMRVTWHHLYYGDFLGVLLCTRTPLDDAEVRLNPPPNLCPVSVYPDTRVIRTFWAHYYQLVRIWKRVLLLTLKYDYDLDDPLTIALEQELVGWYEALPPTWHHDKATDYALYSPLAAQAVLTLKIHSEAARYFFIKPIIEELDVAMVRDAREGRMRPEKVEALHKQWGGGLVAAAIDAQAGHREKLEVEC
ncbi:hypothetical protein BC937DRAFT_95062 [Endogone sp. FLAS-F59071]|nr:hypothetical protein BC937DRAFT_95062 [Endogone sp. FLAS-F59071]|eukprot:RUS20493.1 hypothetical protein BC937DRAFT_95062 [Endogone sp. FLAS-F59071]